MERCQLRVIKVCLDDDVAKLRKYNLIKDVNIFYATFYELKSHSAIQAPN